MKILTIVLEYWTESPLQHYTKKPNLLNVANFSTMFCPRLSEKNTSLISTRARPPGI